MTLNEIYEISELTKKIGINIYKENLFNIVTKMNTIYIENKFNINSIDEDELKILSILMPDRVELFNGIFNFLIDENLDFRLVNNFFNTIIIKYWKLSNDEVKNSNNKLKYIMSMGILLRSVYDKLRNFIINEVNKVDKDDNKYKIITEIHKFNMNVSKQLDIIIGDSEAKKLPLEFKFIYCKNLDNNSINLKKLLQNNENVLKEFILIYFTGNFSKNDEDTLELIKKEKGKWIF